jgi:arylsulfatase A-like enzyme
MSSNNMRLIISIAGALLLISMQVSVAVADQRPNVLFIACDDLNDWVGFMKGHPDTITPNMDRLAQRGVVFDRAYCASPICGPSRAAILTGFKPETSGVYNNAGTYIDYVPNAVVLPRFFKNNGYLVMGAGKINHAMGCVVPENYHEFGPDAGAIGGPFTWEELNMNPGIKVERKDIAGISDNIASGIVKNIYPGKQIKRGSLAATLPLNNIDNRIDRPANGYNTFDWGPVSVSDDDMPDGKMATWAEQKLKSQFTSPFFLAVGFYRPHQPWYAPAKYYEPFAGRELAVPVTVNRDLDDCGPAARHYAHYPWSGSFATVQKHNQWQDAIRGYLASIHFVDAQVGRLLDALDASPYKENTIIVLWSDHGWELGEKEHWGKHSPWEGSIRVPLVIVPPASMKVTPKRTAAFASLLDLYPTLTDLCGLDIPNDLDGRSLAPVLTGKQRSVRDYIVTSLGRSTFCIRQGDMKLIRYYDGSEELYDLKGDPHEFRNLVNDPVHTKTLRKLRTLAPEDKRYRQFVRYGRFKATVASDGTMKLYDMLHPKSGIGEQTEVSAENLDVVSLIRKHLEDNKVTERYYTMFKAKG